MKGSLGLIFPVLMILTSCVSVPTTPRLPVAVRPDYPILQDYELDLLRDCKTKNSLCEIYPETLIKISRKDQLCRDYARELKNTILDNNQHSN